MINTGNCVSKYLMAFLARKEGNSMAYQLQLVLLDSKKLSLEIAKSNSSVTAFQRNVEYTAKLLLKSSIEGSAVDS